LGDNGEAVLNLSCALYTESGSGISLLIWHEDVHHFETPWVSQDVNNDADISVVLLQ